MTNSSVGAGPRPDRMEAGNGAKFTVKLKRNSLNRSARAPAEGMKSDSSCHATPHKM